MLFFKQNARWRTAETGGVWNNGGVKEKRKMKDIERWHRRCNNDIHVHSKKATHRTEWCQILSPWNTRMMMINKHACMTLLNTETASNVKFKVNSFQWQDFLLRHFPNFWSISSYFPDICLIPGISGFSRQVSPWLHWHVTKALQQQPSNYLQHMLAMLLSHLH